MLKEYNVQCHYETHLAEKDAHSQGQVKVNKLNELLEKEQYVFNHSLEHSDTNMRARIPFMKIRQV